MDTVGVPLHAYPWRTRFSQKKKKNSIWVWYGSGQVGYGLGTSRTKTKPNGIVLGLNSNPISFLHPILSHSILSNLIPSLLCSRFSLFSALDSLCLSLPHSTGVGQRNGRGDCGSEDLRRAGDSRTSLIVDLIVVFFDFFSHCGSDCSDCGMGLRYFC
jgi:hypothetical protein